MPGVDPPWDKPQGTQFDEEAERKAREPLIKACQFCKSPWARFAGQTVHFECGTSTWIVGKWQDIDEHRHWNQSPTCKDRQIAKLREMLNEAGALAQKFVDKVESGRARSKETYAECKALLVKIKKVKY